MQRDRDIGKDGRNISLLKLKPVLEAIRDNPRRPHLHQLQLRHIVQGRLLQDISMRRQQKGHPLAPIEAHHRIHSIHQHSQAQVSLQLPPQSKNSFVPHQTIQQQ